MSETSLPPVGRAVDSSVILGLARRVAAGSVLCAAAAAAARRLDRIRRPMVSGLEWSCEREMQSTARLETLIAASCVAAAMSVFADAPVAAWREATVMRLVKPIFDVELETRVRIAGCIVLIAVSIHTFLLGVLGAPVHALGWSLRAGLLMAALAAIWRPRPLAAAWRDRATGAVPGEI